MPDFPSGTVTFLVTNIAGSTARWERDRQAMAQVVERHLAVLDAAIPKHDGVHFKTGRDAVRRPYPPRLMRLPLPKSGRDLRRSAGRPEPARHGRRFRRDGTLGGAREAFSGADQHRTDRLPQHRDA